MAKFLIYVAFCATSIVVAIFFIYTLPEARWTIVRIHWMILGIGFGWFLYFMWPKDKKVKILTNPPLTDEERATAPALKTPVQALDDSTKCNGCGHCPYCNWGHF